MKGSFEHDEASHLLQPGSRGVQISGTDAARVMQLGLKLNF